MAVSIRRDGLKHWALYLVKAVVLFGALGLFCLKAGSLPGFAVALVWAALASISTLGLMYYAVVRKARRQLELRDGGRLARINQGRALRIVACFVLSAVGSAGLILEAARWDVAHLCLAGAGVVVFFLAYLLVDKLLRREFKPVVRTARITAGACVLTGVLLCAAYLAMLFILPEQTYSTAAEAFLAAEQPFEGSPSALMGEAGTLASFADGLTSYALGAASGFSSLLYPLLSVVLLGGAFFTLANLLGVCSLRAAELKRVFLPLEACGEEGCEEGNATAEPATISEPAAVETEPTAATESAAAPSPSAPSPAATSPASPSPMRPIGRYVGVFAALPVVLLAGFLVADREMSLAYEGVEVTPAQALVRDEVDLAVYVLDGHYYDQQAVNALVEQATLQSAALSQEAQAALEPLINEVCDKRLKNVDSYLDWYYSLTGDYEQLFSMVTGSAEEFAEQQFATYIEAGADTSRLTDTLGSYCTQIDELYESVNEQLASYEMTGVPSWLFKTIETLSTDFLAAPMEPTQKLLSFGERMGISVASGGVTGVVAGRTVHKGAAKVAEQTAEKAGKEVAGEATGKVTKTLVSKVTGKEFFKVLVKKITSKLGSRAVGSAIGGAVGVVGGPAGVAVGIAAGAAVSVGVDAALVQVDEWMNRDSYREEIVSAIEEDRDEWLAQLGATE